MTENNDIELQKEAERLKVAANTKYKEQVQSLKSEVSEKSKLLEEKDMSFEDLKKSMLAQQEELKAIREQQKKDAEYIIQREKNSLLDFVRSQPEKYPTILETQMEDLVFDEMVKGQKTYREACEAVEGKLYDFELKKMQNLNKHSKYQSVSQNVGYQNADNNIHKRLYESANHSIPDTSVPSFNNKSGTAKLSNMSTQELIEHALNGGRK